VRAIAAAESVTQLGDVAGKVLVAGSHGGIIAANLGARAGVHALILNDAGVGKDKAGIAGLSYLDAIGMAAATVDCLSARIGDGADMLARGRISHANALALACGVRAGLHCGEAAQLLCRAPAPRSLPPPYDEGRWLLLQGPPEAWALDSVGKLVPEDGGRILVIGSHGALHGGRPESALAVDASGAVFNDAGFGADGIGTTRLTVLDARGIPAATVACASARIGDGRSMWQTGVLSCINAAALRCSIAVGDTVQQFAARLVAASRR
jgi:hypothetical protein